MVKSINGEIIKQKNMHKKSFNVKGIYFFNWMIPFCRSFTSTLREFYEKLQQKYGKENFEIFGCMFDQEKYSDENLLKSMPWCTLKCSKETLDRIKFTLGVFHVPSLVLLDENNEIITRNGRWLISSDQNCEKFNWNQWKWDALNPIQWNSIRPWNFYLLWEMPSLIIFGDSDDETYIDEWMIAVGHMQFTNLQNHYIRTSITVFQIHLKKEWSTV
jgi:thiol-disulfide isomerase/thioredoxin